MHIILYCSDCVCICWLPDWVTSCCINSYLHYFLTTPLYNNDIDNITDRVPIWAASLAVAVE